MQIIQKQQLRGAEIFAAQLSQHLSMQGHEVKIVALGKGDAQLPFGKTIVSLDLSLSNRFLDVSGWRKLAGIVREFCPDIVQANAGDTLKYAALSRLVFRWKPPLVFRNANKVSDFINSAAKSMFNKFLVSQLNHVISVSELCRQDFVHTYRYDSALTSTIPIGVEQYGEVPPLAPEMEDLIRNHKIVLNVGSIVPEKNQSALVRIAERLVKQIPEIRVLIVGDGRLRKVLQEQIDNAGLAWHVILTGYRTDVLSLMRRANVLVVPSLVEGLPGVILEAFYSGLPVVASDVGGISEVVQDGKTGWLVTKNNEDELYNAVLDALTSGQSVSRAEYARQLAETQFLNSIIASKFERVYMDILRRHE